jgi:hypothetical protein
VDEPASPILSYAPLTAEEFWETLSPQRHLFGPNERPIFRGHANAKWSLEPSLLRNGEHCVYQSLPGLRTEQDSVNQIFMEIHSLNTFARYCDEAGLRIPGDSEQFRREWLHPPKQMESFMLRRKLWPSSEYFPIMALAQHHGVPTRLLDWSKSSYVAAYFAAAGALRPGGLERLAVWALNVESVDFWKLKHVEIVKVPGSNNANLAAQRGLFTILRQEYVGRGQPFTGTHRVEEYVASTARDHLVRITLPVSEAPKVIDLCERNGITGAALFPDFYGAAKATLDHLLCWSRAEWLNGQDIHATTLPVPFNKGEDW